MKHRPRFPFCLPAATQDLFLARGLAFRTGTISRSNTSPSRSINPNARWRQGSRPEAYRPEPCRLRVYLREHHVAEAEPGANDEIIERLRILQERNDLDTLGVNPRVMIGKAMIRSTRISECVVRVVDYQALGGGLYAVDAHCASDGLGTGGHLRPESVLQSAPQRVGGRCTGCVRRADAKVVDSLCPVVLVVHLGDDDLGGAG